MVLYNIHSTGQSVPVQNAIYFGHFHDKHGQYKPILSQVEMSSFHVDVLGQETCTVEDIYSPIPVTALLPVR